MELRLFNTLTKEKEAFSPLDPARGVRMYVCGPTVYDFAHIGNARPVIVFDVLYRLLRHLYGEGKVKYVRNITDVDDKINARAAEEYPKLPLNEAIRLVTEKTEKQFHEDVDALGCLRPDVEPRATEHIGEMRELIERLVKAGFAYVEQEHVLFEVGKMADYGKLARRSLNEMEAGARVEVAPYKRNPMDFVLWKPSKPNEPGWPSPSGIKTPGRPGWHIECSAMSWKHLGETFDIHGGGIDLVFPHHENEIAQSRCSFHSPIMAKTWMHNGFLQVEGEKMSKSLGNFITIHELLGDFFGPVVRFMMLRTHYRQPIDWRKSELERTRHELWGIASIICDMAVEEYYHSSHRDLIDVKVLVPLCEDLNTPLALNNFIKLANEAKHDRERAKSFAATAAFLGIQHLDKQHLFTDSFVSSVPDEKRNAYGAALHELILFKNYSANNAVQSAAIYAGAVKQKGIIPTFSIEKGLVIKFQGTAETESDELKIDRLIAERNDARARKDWKESDRIRDELKAMGVVIKDNKDGTTTWEIAR